MFPVLDPSEIERVRHFGKLRSYRKGDALAKAGSVTEGFTIVLSGRVDVNQHGSSGQGKLIVTHGPGSFMGELAQLENSPGCRRRLETGHFGWYDHLRAELLCLVVRARH